MNAFRALQFVAICSMSLAANDLFAGTLCGTVTDRASGAPVAHAGVFLRDPGGAFTGIAGATDALGAFCIGNVPAGTYDVEVRVDDYQVAYLRGVEVTEGTTGIDVGAAPGLVHLAAPWPNPARIATRIRWTLAEPSRVMVSIHDARGRYLRGWAAPLASPGEHFIDWDLRDARGRPMPPGTYFIRLDAGDSRHSGKLILVR